MKTISLPAAARCDPVNEQEEINEEKKSETSEIIKMFGVIPANPANRPSEHSKQRGKEMCEYEIVMGGYRKVQDL